jgi:ketosteroid isomerase-like protein
LTYRRGGVTVDFRDSTLYIERRSKMGSDVMVGPSTATPEQVLESIVAGINSGNLESLMPLYESEAAFATEPGSLAHGTPGVREALTGFISMNGELDLEATRVLEVDDLALVIGIWSFNGTGPDGEPVRLASRNADVLRRQSDGTWRFVIDNPWGTD